MVITTHAKERMLQRGLYPFHIELLQKFGNIAYHKGSQVLSLNKKSKKKIRNYFGPKLAGEIFSGNVPFLVEANGKIVTMARKTKAFRNNR